MPLPISPNAEDLRPIEIENDPFPSTLRGDIAARIRHAYGEEAAEDIYNTIARLVREIRVKRPVPLLEQDFARSSDWYRNEVIYMFYTERFGVDTTGRPNTFKDTIPMLDYLQTLGVTTLYMLPFLESPMIDAGFDVSNFRQVRPDLGGNEEFELFLTEAKRRGFKIKADLILNHISDQHAWFQAALHGDAEKLNYFVVRDTPPVFHLENQEQKGVVVIYEEDDGSRSERRLMFPDIATSHYRHENVQGNDLYFYHTFYPHQLDLNWANPKVLYEAIELMGFWGNKGIDIFRLDAIPFFRKKPGTNGESLPETHAVLKIISACLQAMAPATVLQAEACQWPRDIRHYYGDDRQFSLSVESKGEKALTRTDEMQIAYHFPWMPAIWASMVTADPTSFWKATEETPEIPASAGWAIFLRVHDELTLEMVDPQTRQAVYDKLVDKGQPFRAGLGVSGRLADFLDNDPRRIELIYSILLSLPGIPILYFGDEIGERNHVDFMEQAAEERKQRSAKLNDQEIEVKSFLDTRDLGRAPIQRARFLLALDDAQTKSEDKSLSGRVFSTLQQQIRTRKLDDVLVKGDLVQVPTDQPTVLAYMRRVDAEARLVVHNLCGEPVTVTLNVPEAFQDATLHDMLCGVAVKDIMPTQEGLQLPLAAYQSYWLQLPVTG